MNSLPLFRSLVNGLLSPSYSNEMIQAFDFSILVLTMKNILEIETSHKVIIKEIIFLSSLLPSNKSFLLGKSFL